MRPISVTATGVSNSAWIPVDYEQASFSIGFGCIVSGTVTYTVQHCFDDLNDSTVTPTPFNHPFVAAVTANADGNYAYAVSGIRISISAGTGSVTLKCLQGRK